MAVSINRSAQTDKKESLPLSGTWYKEHPEHKNLYLGVTGVKPSKSGEWVLVEICGKFMAILHSESSQYEALEDMLEAVQENGHTLVACFSTQTKSGVEFGLDDEVKGWIKRNEDGHYSLSWERTVDGPFITPNLPTPPSPEPIRKGKKNDAGSSAPKQALESTQPPF
jgi:hypothetical protein